MGGGVGGEGGSGDLYAGRWWGAGGRSKKQEWAKKKKK